MIDRSFAFYHNETTSSKMRPVGRAAILSARSRRILFMQWQSELKRRTRPSIVNGRQPPSVCLDDRAADRQSHSHAAGFGGEEGVEQPIHVLGGDSDAAVLHRNQDLVCFVPLRSDSQFPWP